MAERDEIGELAKDLARHARWARALGERDAPAIAPGAVARAATAPATAAPTSAAPTSAAPTSAAPTSADLATPDARVGGEAAVADPIDLAALQAELQSCARCSLGRGRKNLVFGVGNPHAQLVFVGEGPGADEDEQGIPFVGKAGQLLTKMIEAMGYAREDVYICNVVKCRPPGNRNPESDEIAACEPFLRAQLEAIRPRVIVTLGKFAAQTLLRDSTPITRLRGRWRSYGGIRLMPTFHPAYLLRSPEEKRKAWDDLKLVVAELGRERPGPRLRTESI